MFQKKKRAMVILTTEAAAARRRLQGLPEHMCWEREDTPENAVVLTQGGWGAGASMPETTLNPLQDRKQPPKLARHLFPVQHTQRLQRRPSPPHSEEQGAPETRPGLYGIGDGRKRGKGPRIGLHQV